MFAAVLSLLLDVPTRPDVAMTGELTLRGSVLAVTGVKDKILAAHRGGIREVILPARNEPDLEEVPEEIKQELQIRLVSHVDQILRWALESPPGGNELMAGSKLPPAGEMRP